MNDKLIDTEKIANKRLIRQKAVAYLQRGREAGIPNKHLRIKREVFQGILCPNYHKGKILDIVNLVYDKTDYLIEKPFILIDGGNIESRFKAAYTIMFRLILCDRRGFHIDCGTLSHKLQSITVNSIDQISRNDLVEELKRYDILFISEFSRSIFKPHWESGEFFDDILSWRLNNLKPTIVTFSDAINKATAKLNQDCGRYLADLTVKEQSTDEVFRVKVKAQND